jgi:hypothetical protein
VTTPTLPTLLVDLNSADGIYVSVFLDHSAFVSGSPAYEPGPGDYVWIRAEGGIRCLALGDRVRNGVATLKLDMDFWSEEPQVDAQQPFGAAPSFNTIGPLTTSGR